MWEAKEQSENLCNFLSIWLWSETSKKKSLKNKLIKNPEKSRAKGQVS